MLRRLLAVLVPMAVLVVAALGLPVGVLIAQRETQEMYVDRLNDVGRFASLAETALARERTEALEMELERYAEVYGIPTALVDPDGEVVLASWPPEEPAPAWLTEEPTQRILSQALAGYRPDPPPAVWPWQDDPLILAEPVGRDSEVVGVVVAMSPTDRLAANVLRGWAWLALAGLVPLAGLTAVAWPVSRWVLRPVRQLDEATAAIAEGDLSARADARGGPPELRRLARSFNAMVDVVEQALERQRAFVADASHQLRNPLASLRLAVENLAVFLREPEARQAHGEAVEEAKAMHRMLNSLLAATRLDSAKRAEPAAVDTIMETHATRWEALAHNAGFSLDLRVPAGLVVLEPPGGLGSVLDELVSNALRLSGGTRVEIGAREEPGAASDDRSAVAPGAGTVRLWVRDDGDGLGGEERTAALGRFWRAPKHQNIVGTGLGLAICAELVNAAGGRLVLEDGLERPDGAGVGLAVVMTLPRRDEPPEPPEQPSVTAGPR